MSSLSIHGLPALIGGMAGSIMASLGEEKSGTPFWPLKSINIIQNDIAENASFSLSLDKLSCNM